MTDTVQQPSTTWDHCLRWAALLIDTHRQQQATSPHGLSLEEHLTWQGDELPLTTTLMSAALHHQIGLQDLQEADPHTAAGLWLHHSQADQGGVERLLRHSPYATVEQSPDIADRGAVERTQLLISGVASHPDGPLLWHRVRVSALSVVEGHLTRGAVTMRDVLEEEGHRVAAARFAQRLDDVFGDEY